MKKSNLKVYEERVLRRIFKPISDEVVGGWESSVMRSFVGFAGYVAVCVITCKTH
jgi:hypothetical protein